VTAGPEVDSDHAAELMLGGGFRHLPVVEDGRLAGVVSLRDLLSVRIVRRTAVAPPGRRGRRLWPPGRRQPS
jgi:CBS domain-containing protein